VAADGDADTIRLPPGARMVLLGPDAVAHRLAARDTDPARRWLLGQPRAVRRSFVEQVIDAGGSRRAQERWLLLADEPVRRSFVEQVVDAPEGSG
jgi:hypothetical protein